MLPAGYLLKRVLPPPGWLNTGVAHVTTVCSVSDCVNANVVDVQSAWQHNGFGLANSPQVLFTLAEDGAADLTDATLFYYECYEHELGSDGWTFDATAWEPLTRIPSAGVEDAVHEPERSGLQFFGYDVVTFNDYLEHSPLSCNSIAEKLLVNEHCLFREFSEAKQAIDSGGFGEGCEDGVYKIFSVYLVT